jgi:hypothetical protein
MMFEGGGRGGGGRGRGRGRGLGAQDEPLKRKRGLFTKDRACPSTAKWDASCDAGLDQVECGCGVRWSSGASHHVAYAVGILQPLISKTPKPLSLMVRARGVCSAAYAIRLR